MYRIEKKPSYRIESKKSLSLLDDPENNRGPLIDNLVQFEEDFHSRTKKLRYGGVDWIGYLRPVQFLDHLTVIKPLDHHRLVDYQIVLNYRTIFPYRKSFG